MYYISRFIGQDRYGVVDSDTGREFSVVFGDIELAIRRGYDIAGIIFDKEDTHIDGSPVVSDIVPWEGLRHKSPVASKLQCLCGIDIFVYDGYISSISWKPEKLQGPVSLRLSDFGDTLGDRFLYWGDTRQVGQCLTLVFDDKIRLSPFSFKIPLFYSMESDCTFTCMDIREVTNESLARDIYLNLHGYLSGSHFSKHVSILDHPDRYNRLIDAFEEYV